MTIAKTLLGWAAAGIVLLGAAPAGAFQESALDAVVSVLPDRPGLAQHTDGLRPDELEGSGIAVRAGGYIATALHVVERASDVRVQLRDGRVLETETVGIDRATDIAVLRVTENLPIFTLAAAASVGQPVCTIGSPYGLDHSVTCGVVSALHRAGMGFNPIEDFVQTDAVVNPGASGGALIDTDGNLVGMLSAIFTRETDADIGVNFAVSATLLDRVVDDLVAHGRVVRTSPGFTVIPLDDDERDSLSGVRVDGVSPGGAAEAAGLGTGDVIAAIDGRPVRTGDDVISAIHVNRPGDTVSLFVFRAGETHTLSLTLPDLAR